jgi:hypothetical protein
MELSTLNEGKIVMPKTRNAVVAAIIATALIATTLTTVHAQFEPTADDRSACDKDAYKLCMSAMPSKEAVMLCLKGKKSQLSPRCRAQFDKRGG